MSEVASPVSVAPEPAPRRAVAPRICDPAVHEFEGDPEIELAEAAVDLSAAQPVVPDAVAPSPVNPAAEPIGRFSNESLRSRTIKGDTAGTPYGAVTVTITVTGDKITEITAVLPTGGESAAVAANAGPKLRQQALAKQSADIDSVSGATYTSEGYKESLQSALDKR